MSNPFSDETMAAGYAAARPAVHPLVLARLAAWLGEWRAARAVDLGCGAGMSTRPLLGLSSTCIGVDPAASMVRTAARLLPQARFAVASAAALPFPAASVDLIAAAGSLNYVGDLQAVWPELLRVLTAEGRLAVYDFSPARAFDGDASLDAWFDAFTHRYPYPPRQAIPLSPAIVADRAAGFRVVRAEEFALPLDLTHAQYVAYMLTETNVQDAVQRGVRVNDIRHWLADSLAPLFGAQARAVLFRGYLVVLARRA